MSFGVVQSAMSSIKGNRNLLSKRIKLKNTLSWSDKRKLEFKTPNAKLNQLKRIREKLKQEH